MKFLLDILIVFIAYKLFEWGLPLLYDTFPGIEGPLKTIEETVFKAEIIVIALVVRLYRIDAKAETAANTPTTAANHGITIQK